MTLRLAVCLVLASVILGGCASLPNDAQRKQSHALMDTSDTRIGRLVANLDTSGDGADRFTLLRNGLDAFVARVVLADLAERSLDVQYYLYHQDLVGKLLTVHLIRAADRGVRVRILVDDMDMDGRDASLVALDAHPNIQLRLFNPFDRRLGRLPQFIAGFGTLTRRMHNKSFTVDNQATILGGRNIGNEYFEADPALQFADLDVLAAGGVVKEVSASFDEYWNSPLAHPVTALVSEHPGPEKLRAIYQELTRFMEQQGTSEYMMASRNSALAKAISGGKVRYYPGDAVIVVDRPEKITSSRDANELHLASQLAPHFQGLQRELLIVSPYFVPGEAGVAFFSKLIERGVRVRILTNSLASNDVGIVHAGYAKYRKPLLRAGVELFEMNRRRGSPRQMRKSGIGDSSKASLHAKTFVLDREKTFIGSLNLDPRSFLENTEIGLVMHQREVAENAAQSFNRDVERHAFRLELAIDDRGNEKLLWHGIEDGVPVTFEHDPYTGFWQRLAVALMRLLPIESQL